MLKDQESQDLYETQITQMRIEEQSTIKQIQALKQSIENLKQNHDDYRREFKQNAENLLNYKQIMAEKEILMKELTEKNEDENEIKNVLMIRIRDLEDASKKEEGSNHDLEKKILDLKNSQDIKLKNYQEISMKVNSLEDKFKDLQEDERRETEQNYKRERIFKQEIEREEDEKRKLEHENENLKLKIQKLQSLIGKEDEQLGMVDSKIAELIRMRLLMERKLKVAEAEFNI